MSDILDLRSDTVTVPTPAMRKAMAEAPVGDDVSGEDPSVNRLEREAADLLGKDAGLLVPSGTFANQCAMLTFTNSGDEVLLSERCHIIQHEAGAAALISRVQLRPLSPDSPYLRAEDAESRVRTAEDVHYPRTALICVEQATSDGTVTPLAELKKIRALADRHGIKVYMDGARVFNAAAALGVPPAEAAASADAVGFCLSKGLCAPVGSVLVGSKDFIAKARYNRKRMGGGMRQAGVLAAPGLTALADIRPRLAEDHEKAKELAGLLAVTPGVELLRDPEINMVFVRLPGLKLAVSDFVTKLAERGIRIYPDESGVFRFVTHYYVPRDGVRRFADELRRLLDP